MYAVAAALLFMTSNVAEQQARHQPNIDGVWTVACLEKNGQTIQEAKNTQVTAKDNVITFTDKLQKQVHTLRLEFGERGTIRVTELENTSTGEQNRNQQQGQNEKEVKAKAGVYVSGRDFLAICVHAEGETGAEKTRENANTNDAAKPHHVVILLKREGQKDTQTR